MANFKKLSTVEAVNAVSDAATVLIEENGTIKRVSKDEICGGIKVASAAEVGQTIVVKAVDENGRPTEWECADMNVGEKMDIVLTVNLRFGWHVSNSVVTISEGSMENVRNAVVEGRIPKGKIIFKEDSGASEYGVYGNYVELTASFYCYGGYIWMSCLGHHPLYENAAHSYKFVFDDTGTIINVFRCQYQGSVLE